MNWTIKLNETQSFLTVTIKGTFNADDHFRMIEEIISKPFWKPGMNVLFDSRELNHLESDFYIMQEASINMAKFDAQIGSGKAAILMRGTDNFKKGQQFEMLTEAKVSAEIGVFQDEAAAVEWLSKM